MPDTMDQRLGIGGNNPPLPELLKEETAELSARSAELLGAVERCHVENDETAGRATTLAKMLADHSKAVDKRREDRKAPFLEGGKMVDAHFKAIIAPLDAAKARVVAMIDSFRREQQRKADEERRRLEEEARAKREEAEAAAAVGGGDIDAEIEAQQFASEAASLEAKASEIKAPVVQSEYGAKAFGRKVWRHEIEDVNAVFKYLLKTDKPRVTESLSEIVGRLVKAGIREIPGAKIYEDTQTVVR